MLDALPTSRMDMGAYTEVDLYIAGKCSRYRPHFPAILPLGKRRVDVLGSSFLQCRKCFAVNSFKVEANKEGIIWVCQGQLQAELPQQQVRSLINCHKAATETRSTRVTSLTAKHRYMIEINVGSYVLTISPRMASFLAATPQHRAQRTTRIKLGIYLLYGHIILITLSKLRLSK